MNRLISKVLCYGALFLFLMSVSFVAQAAEADKQNPLAGTEWELVSPEYKGLQKKPFLKFTECSYQCIGWFERAGRHVSSRGQKP